MPATLHSPPRVDTLKLKLHIVRKLGHEKSEKYFHLLNQYLSCKLSKSEFDVLCIGVVGRENILLHNHLIRAILRNAFVAETSPSEIRSSLSLNVKLPNGCLRGNLQSLCRDAFPKSPRKGRTPNIRDRKFRDRFSPLGPHGKSHVATTCEDSVPKFTEEQKNADEIYCRSSIIPPIGISIKGQQKKKYKYKKKKKKLVLDGLCNKTCLSCNELPDSVSLKARLDKDLEMEGFTVSVDSVNLLNRGLDVYLKRLILPSLELARSQTSNNNKGKSENGMMRYLEKRKRATIFASLMDFQVALEANPKSLGEAWPVQLERICLHSPSSELEMKFSG